MFIIQPSVEPENTHLVREVSPYPSVPTRATYTIKLYESVNYRLQSQTLTLNYYIKWKYSVNYNQLL